MKNLMLIIVAVFSIIFSGCSGSSELRLGDIPLNEVAQAKEEYVNIIRTYEEQEITLRDKNDDLLIQLQDTSSNEMLRADILKKIRFNDSLASSYRSKMNLVENELNAFIIKAAGKDKQKRISIDVRGGNLQDMANLIAVSSYYDGKTGTTGITDSAAIKSFSTKNIRADVYFAGRRIVSCFLDQNNSTRVIKIPGPGQYDIVFTDLNSGESIKLGRFVDCIGRDMLGEISFAFVSTVGG